MFLLCINCSSSNDALHNSIKYIEFTNRNTKNIKIDKQIIKDKDFEMKIPNSLEKHIIKVSYFFSQHLVFKKGERILIIYIPNKSFLLEKMKEVYTIKEFQNLLEQLDIVHEIGDVKLKENRYFNIRLLEKNFFIMYLNVYERDVQDFNFSINSMKLN